MPNTDERDNDAITVSYSKAVAAAAPAVVNIYANKVVTSQQYLVPTNPAFQRVFPGIAVGAPTKRATQSLGSGVIVSADGYVVTNNHVIQGAEEINVVLFDGRQVTARVIGGDVETDLAVLKIDAENLPSITIADKNPLNVGDVVLAIGNPFGIGTHGDDGHRQRARTSVEQIGVRGFHPDRRGDQPRQLRRRARQRVRRTGRHQLRTCSTAERRQHVSASASPFRWRLRKA